MPFVQIAQLILGFLPYLPGAIQAGEGLVQAIQGIGALTPEEQAALVGVTRAAVKAEARSVAGVPVWHPAPTANPATPIP